MILPGTPWQIPLFLLLNVQTIQLKRILHRHSTKILLNCVCVIKCQSFFYLYVKYQVDGLGNTEVAVYSTCYQTNKKVQHYANLILCLRFGVLCSHSEKAFQA